VTPESYADAMFAQFPGVKIDFKHPEATLMCFLQQLGRASEADCIITSERRTQVMKPLTLGHNCFLIRELCAHQRITLRALKRLPELVHLLTVLRLLASLVEAPRVESPKPQTEAPCEVFRCVPSQPNRPVLSVVCLGFLSRPRESYAITNAELASLVFLPPPC